MSEAANISPIIDVSGVNVPEQKSKEIEMRSLDRATNEPASPAARFNDENQM